MDQIVPPEIGCEGGLDRVARSAAHHHDQPREDRCKSWLRTSAVGAKLHRTSAMEIWATIEEYIRDHVVDLTGRAVAALAIILAAWILARVARRAVDAAIRRRGRDRRLSTLAPALQSLVRVLVLGTGVVMALHQLGINIATVLAGAGVVGLAVGFGAQTLVRDVISGFFLIVDGVIEAEDHVTFNQVTGIAEEVGLRVTKIRSFDGKLWYVPNGELKIVGNFNRGWSRAVVNVSLAYEQDIAAGLKVVQEVGDAWAAEHDELVLEPPEAQGVLGLNASDIAVRLVIKVKPMEHFAIERELGRRLKEAFDNKGIEIPFPRQVVYHRGDHPGTTRTSAT